MYSAMGAVRWPAKSLLRCGAAPKGVMPDAHKPLVNNKVGNNTASVFVTFFNSVKSKACVLYSNHFHMRPFDTTLKTFHVVAYHECEGSRRSY
jgi:hypothetical protein